MRGNCRKCVFSYLLHLTHSLVYYVVYIKCIYYIQKCTQFTMDNNCWKRIFTEFFVLFFNLLFNLFIHLLFNLLFIWISNFNVEKKTLTDFLLELKFYNLHLVSNFSFLFILKIVSSVKSGIFLTFFCGWTYFLKK